MAWWLIAAVLAGGMPAQDGMGGMAMKPAAPCPATPAPLPADYAGWRTMAASDAAVDAAAAPTLPVGSGAKVTLRPSSQLHYAAPMKHMGTTADFGGVLSFSVAKTGRYRVSLGAAAWIDVVAGGATQTSVAHGHGPDCSGIRKIVEFDLKPGAYLLQIAGNAAPTLGVMVTPVGG